MDLPHGDSPRPRPVERFKPTNGVFLGAVGLVVCAVTIAYVAWSVHSLAGLRVGLGAAFFALVIWVTQMRPRATAYPHTLVLRNSLRDAVIPLGIVDEAAMGQTLNIWVGDDRYVCIGIGQSFRADLKARRREQQSLLGASRWHDFAMKAAKAAPDQTAMSYQTFVITRIQELIEQEKKTRRGNEVDQRVRRTLAWPELVGLLLTAGTFVVSLVV
jgi:hypothetical protein